MRHHLLATRNLPISTKELGDGTEEQNLNQPGTPGARIEKNEVTAAFEKNAPPKS
jgi:hypothetical protein